MGLYDEFVWTGICPFCNKEDKFNTQTKVLACLMRSYEIGDSVIDTTVQERLGEDLVIHSADIITDDTHYCGPEKNAKCSECNREIERKEKFWRQLKVTLMIRDGKFVGVKDIQKIETEEEWRASWEKERVDGGD